MGADAIQPVTVPRLFPDGTVLSIAGGPSLTPEQIAHWRGQADAVIAVNDAYRLAPDADVLYAGDVAWWKHYRGVPTFHGLKFTIAPRAKMRIAASPWPGVQTLANTGVLGLEREPTGLRTGLCSGYQAIGLAVHLGAARIVLLGYDLQLGEHGQTHWFGNHPSGLSNRSTFGSFLAAFASLVAPLAELGISVINASPRTKLRCFPLFDGAAA